LPWSRHEFDSRYPLHFARLAEKEMRRPAKPDLAGSIPAPCSGLVIANGKQPGLHPGNAGSIPAESTIFMPLLRERADIGLRNRLWVVRVHLGAPFLLTWSNGIRPRPSKPEDAGSNPVVSANRGMA
jgi:hypothetical protein